MDGELLILQRDAVFQGIISFSFPSEPASKGLTAFLHTCQSPDSPRRTMFFYEAEQLCAHEKLKKTVCKDAYWTSAFIPWSYHETRPIDNDD
jgi:hypothetical protein